MVIPLEMMREAYSAVDGWEGVQVHSQLGLTRRTLRPKNNKRMFKPIYGDGSNNEIPYLYSLFTSIYEPATKSKFKSRDGRRPGQGSNPLGPNDGRSLPS